MSRMRTNLEGVFMMKVSAGKSSRESEARPQIRVNIFALSTTFFLENHATISKIFLEDRSSLSKKFSGTFYVQFQHSPNVKEPKISADLSRERLTCPVCPTLLPAP